jgi:hypothetical protein|tara:strand:+ start:710 stop:1450 length:741 start_codon:yes stop_codon:yes gene_type:complete
MKITTNEQKQSATTNREEVLGLFSIKHSVDTLRTEALNWSDRSKSELYNILYKCLLLVETINEQSADDLIRTNAELDILIRKCNFESKATKVPNKIIQLVFDFDMDRKLTSKYASVLNRFIETKQSESQFISWLTHNGGINGVLSSNTKNTNSGLTAEQKLSTAIGIVSSSDAIATIENQFGIETNKAFVLYCVPNAEGKLEVKKVVTDDKFIKPITASFYDAELKQSIDADAVEDSVRNELKKAS